MKPLAHVVRTNYISTPARERKKKTEIFECNPDLFGLKKEKIPSKSWPERFLLRLNILTQVPFKTGD